MSHFDFPRINFYGKCLLDPATANNGFYVPLVIYDPLNVKTVMPPRIYLTKDTVPKGKLQDVLSKVPDGAEVKVDREGRLAGEKYVEVTPINTLDIFREWAVVPLGEFDKDKDYLPLYEAVHVPNTNSSLKGAHPGYWNYYGQQRVSFDWSNGSYIEHVEVSSIATGVNSDGKETIYPNTSDVDQIVPEDIASILGKSVSLNNIPDDTNTHMAVMTDLDPTFALYTQIFNDWFGVYDGNTPLLRGTPHKFSMRFPNVFRIVNEKMPNSGSGDFISSIPMEQLEDAESSEIISFIKKHSDPDRLDDLQGVFIRFNMLEVQENRPPDYTKIGKASNVARVTVAGSIAPWYKGEMRSLVMGRQMIPDTPFNTEWQSSFAPCVMKYNKKDKVVTIDALNILPILNPDLERKGASPPSNSNPAYETYDLGKVELKLKMPDGKLKDLASLTVNKSELPREQFLRSGGMLHFRCDESEHEMHRGLLELHGTNEAKAPVRLMKEAEYMINSDEAGLYANQGDEPAQGYVSYGYPRSHCKLRIFHKGRPVKKRIPICVQENMVTAHGGSQGAKIFRNAYFKDGDVITFPTTEVSNAMYLLTYGHLKNAMPVGQIQGMIVATGAFISTRILPRQDYAKYLDPRDPEYPTEVTWDVIEREVFDTIRAIYPAMDLKAPLTGSNWDNLYMAGLIVSRIDENLWNSSKYMPPTRDLSDMQRRLIYKWALSKGVDVPLTYDEAIDEDAHTDAGTRPDYSHLSDNYQR